MPHPPSCNQTIVFPTNSWGVMRERAPFTWCRNRFSHSLADQVWATKGGHECEHLSLRTNPMTKTMSHSMGLWLSLWLRTNPMTKTMSHSMDLWLSLWLRTNPMTKTMSHSMDLWLSLWLRTNPMTKTMSHSMCLWMKISDWRHLLLQLMAVSVPVCLTTAPYWITNNMNDQD